MTRITDVYNQVYIYLNLQLDKDIASKNNKIDEAVQNFFSHKGIRNVNQSERLRIKADIIKTYKNEGSADEETRLGRAIYNSTQKMERSLMLSKIASTPISFSKIKNYEEQKKAYLSDLKNSTDDRDKEFIEHLDNPKILNLATSIERDFVAYKALESANLSMGMTLNDFARILVSKYEPAILEIFEEKGKSTVGRDELTGVYLALILLQKGDDFANAVIALDKNMESMDKSMKLFVGPLMSKVATPVSIVEGIQEFKPPT